MLQSLAVLQPQRLLFSRRGLLGALCSFRGDVHLGLLQIARFIVLGKRGQRREQKGGDGGFHWKLNHFEGVADFSG